MALSVMYLDIQPADSCIGGKFRLGWKPAGLLQVDSGKPSTFCRQTIGFLYNTHKLLYNTVHYNTVLDPKNV